MTDRAQVAQNLIGFHFDTDEFLEEVYVSLGEGDEPIRLLEINSSVIPRETFEPFTFSRTKGVPYRTSIALVRREELTRLRETLPPAWRDYESWQRYDRMRHAG